MNLRLVLSAALVCGLLACEATGAAARGETFDGRTSQGHKIKIRKQGDRAIRLVRFNADLNCRDGTALLLQESGFLWTKLGRDGRFKDVQYGPTDTVRFRGRATKRRINGRVRLEDRLGKKRVRCTSRWIRFNATR